MKAFIPHFLLTCSVAGMRLLTFVRVMAIYTKSCGHDECANCRAISLGPQTSRFYACCLCLELHPRKESDRDKHIQPPMRTDGGSHGQS